MSVLSDTVASLRDVGATAEVVRDNDEGGFAWAELGDIAASIDIVTDDDKGSWFAHVTAADARIIEHRPTATQLHGIVLSFISTETITLMDTKLRFYGQLRPAYHCGVLHGRNVYYIDVDLLAPSIGYDRAIVRVSLGTIDQTSPIFIGASHSDSDLNAVLAIEWSDSDAAARARAWVAEECTGRGEKLIRLAHKMRGLELVEVEVSP